MELTQATQYLKTVDMAGAGLFILSVNHIIYRKNVYKIIPKTIRIVGAGYSITYDIHK